MNTGQPHPYLNTRRDGRVSAGRSDPSAAAWAMLDLNWLRENPMPGLEALIEAPGRRLAAARDEPYDPVKHRPSWEEITAVHDEFDRALANWRRRYFEWQLQHAGLRR